MINIKAIIEGWGNYIFPNEKKEIEAKRRAAICASCPHAKRHIYKKLMPDYSLQEVEGMICEVCGCPLSTLLRQDEKGCELGKW